jgi:hypothetical protein
MFLSVPIPQSNEKIQPVVLVYADTSKVPAIFNLKVKASDRLTSLKDALSAVSGVAAGDMVITDMGRDSGLVSLFVLFFLFSPLISCLSVSLPHLQR